MSSGVEVSSSSYTFSLEDVERPSIEPSQAADLVQQHWGLQVTSVKELGSYEDKNFLVVCGAEHDVRSVSYVLKVHNTHFSALPGFLESQNAVCSHLGFKGIRAPVAEPTSVDSRLIVSTQLKGGTSRMRLLKFVPGSTFKQAKKSPALLGSIGRYLAALDIALQDFWHPGIRPTHDWAITHVDDAVQQFKHLLRDEQQRAVADKISDLYTSLVLPAAGQLRQQVIHGDANENNIIVNESTQQVVALIDWSDILVSWLVAEVAIAATYVLLMTMTECSAAGNSADDQALQAVAHLLAGYTSHLPLTDQEWLMLPVLMAGRLMHSTLIGHYTISKDPGNASYVMPDEADRWRCLFLLMSCPPQEMSNKLRALAQDSIQHATANAAATSGPAPASEQSAAVLQPASTTAVVLPRQLPPFKLELYLAQYEHLPLQLSRSSCQPVPLQQLLNLADPELRQQWEQLELSYPPNIGSLQLRQEVSLQYPGTCPDEVLSCVPNEGIFITMTALLSPGDVVVAMNPAYQSLIEVARSVGAIVRLWNMDFGTDGNRPYFDLESLHQLMTGDVKCLVVNLPHNPSGWLPTQQQWKEIVDCAAAVDAWLFTDEIYRLLEFNPDQQRLDPAVSCYPGKGISLGGLSKAFGLQGLRAGWLVCKDVTLLQQAERVKSYITTTGPITSEVLAVMALRNQQQLLDRCTDIIRQNITLAEQFFSRWRDVFEWQPPVAGSLCLPRLSTGEPIADFCDRAARECGVVLLPATVYDHHQAAAGNHFRLGLGRTNFKEALAVLSDWLESQYQA